MDEGRKVSRYQQKYVFEVFDIFNDRHRDTVNKDLELALEPLLLNDFRRFVGAGQPSVLHLARFIHNAIITHIDKAAPLLLQKSADAAGEKETEQHVRARRLKDMDVDAIIEQFLLPSRNPELHNPALPQDTPELPELLRTSPKEQLSRLLSLHSSSKFTLNLSNLSAQETLDLLYTCEGMISHIEAYNLRDAAHGMTSSITHERGSFDGEAVDLKSPEQHYSLVSDLQKSLNEDNVISLKRVIRAIILDYEEQHLRLKKYFDLLPPEKQEEEKLTHEYLQMQEKKSRLLDILHNLEKFHNYYKKRTLGSRIGSGSTGRAEHQHGMGLVVLDTLPVRARRAVREGAARGKRSLIPVSALLTKNTHYRCHNDPGISGKKSLLQILLPCKNSNFQRWQDWRLDGFSVHFQKPGNIATLGGMIQNGGSEKLLPDSKAKEKLDHPWKCLNTNLKNSLKVLLGFIPAFLTFSLTKDWWVLAYLGAFIWFGITGSRNIIQSILGGGGLRRSPLLPWNSLISWSRIADSLLYTGFSVPLLDYLVKTVLLDQTFGITTANNPVLLYSVMGLANGIYISGHNTFRGLPKAAATGNFFRSILAIPLAIALNSVIGLVLQASGVPDVSGILQKWAAIISKFASDCVAAIIEGLADRQTNINARLAAYRTKISQLFAVFSRLDMHFPEEDVLEMLQSPKMVMETLNYEAREQEKLIIVNALDLMYFWMYQPRAQKALASIFHEMSREEWLIFYRSQLVLNRQREISQFFVDGLVGRNFAKALSFYLDRSEEYLSEIETLGSTKKWV